jgi:subtilisin family serine protease
MSHHGRPSARIVGFGWFARKRDHDSRRGGVPRRHRRRGNGVWLAIDHLETRTMLSGSGLTIVGPLPSPQETLNVQMLPGDVGALSQLTPLIAAAGASVQATTISGLYTVEGPAANMSRLAEALTASPAVQYAGAVQTVQDQALPDDPDYVNGDEWQLNGTWGINAPGAWSVTTGSDSVIVADTDTGMDYDAPDLIDNVWINQAEIPASVLPNLADVYDDGVITFTDLNNPINQGPGKITPTNGVVDGTSVLAPLSSGGWADGSTQDGDTENPDDLIGWNFASISTSTPYGTNNPLDGDGHGTFTAGEIAEVGNNGDEGTGVEWNAQLMPVQFLDSSGNGTDTAAAEAIEYAVNHGAKVINASWGGDGEDPTIADAIQYADEHGVIIVCAAGNNGADDDTTWFSPASYSSEYANVVSVAAISSNGTLASWSDYGTGTVQLAAPGNDVYGLSVSGNWGTDSGTSMAAPLVTGTIALVYDAHPTWSMSQVIDAVLDTTTPDPNLVGKVTTGGIVNAAAAVANTDGPYVVSATPDGSINTDTGLSSVELDFNEEINPATFTPSQVTITGPGGTISGVSVAAVTGSNDHEFTISFPTQTAAGTYTVKVGPDIQDWYGNDMNQNRNGVNGEPSDAFVETIRQTAPGSADLLSLTGLPATVTAGTSATFTVTALSPNGGTDTGFVGTIAFTSSDPQAGLPADFTFPAAADGVQTFSVTFKTAGPQSITATDTANAAIIGTEDNIIVQGAAAKSLKVTGFPTTDTAGASETFSVTAYDAFGNVATGYLGTLEFTSSDPKAVLPAEYAMAPEDQGTFTFTATLETAGTQSITATDTSTSSLTATESNIVVQAAALHSLVVSGFPTSDTAGTAGSITVTAYDIYGNLATDYTGTVTLTSSDPKAVLPASYTFTTADDGKHTFSATLKTAGTQSITATDTASGIDGTESNIVVVPAALQSLAVAGFPTPDTAGAAETFTVTAVDPYGNVIVGYVGKVQFTSSDPKAVLPASYTFTTADDGKYTFTATLKTAGTQSITATDANTPSVTGTDSNIVVQAAAAQSLTATGFPTSITAGEPGSITVTAYDAYGNVATGYTGTLAFTSSDPKAVLPAEYTFTVADLGTYTFPITLKTAGTQSITVTDTKTSSLTATESGIAVQGSAAAQSFVVTGFPKTDTAGAAGSITVTAYDAYGNVATGYTGTVTFTSSDPKAALPASYTFTTADDGTDTFPVTLDTAGMQSITVTDTKTSSITGSESDIDVQAAAAQTLKATGFPASGTAGVANQVTITAYDAYGNVATGYTGTIAFTSSDPKAVLPASFTFAATNDGTHTFSVTLETAGAQSFTVTDTKASSLTATVSDVTVTAAAASTLKITGFPTSVTAGAASDITVTAYDPYGNVVTGYTGTIAFTSSDAKAILPASYTFGSADAGTHTFPVTLETAGTQSISAVDTKTSTITGDESGIVVDAASASTLRIAGFSTGGTAGVSGDVTVTAYDAYGNVATSYAGTVTLTSSDPKAVLPASYAFAAADAGTHAFPVTFETAGTQSVTATDTNTPSFTATESGIAVQAGAAHAFTIAGFPTTDTAGVAGSVTVTAYDAYGNLATGYVGTVTLTSSDPRAVLSAGYTFTAADAGTHTFPVTLDTAGTQSISVADTTTSSITGSESGITVAAAAASTVKVTGFPTSDTAGTTSDITVTAYDPYGNVAIGYTGTIAFASSDPLAGLPSGYTFTAADAGTDTFPVTLDTAGTQSISVADTTTSSIAGRESGITVKAGAASTVKVTGFPTADTAGATSDLTVTAYDAYGNVATGYTGTIAFTSSDAKAVLPAVYTFAAADAGTYTFSVALDMAGTQSITATDTSDSSLTGTESGIAVEAAGARSLAVTGFPTLDMTGVAGDVTVTAYDAYGNVATGYTGTVVFASSDAKAILPASYTFAAADAGTHTFSVTLESAGSQSITATDKNASSLTGSETGITVRAVPQVAWSAPDSIVYGTTLSATQLDATASVPGTFTYTPAAGTLLAAGGSQTLSVTFTPQDSTYYTKATTTTTIAVTKAVPTVNVTDAGGRFDGGAFPASATIAGVVSGVDNTPAASLGGVAPTLTYYDGSGIAGISLGATAPTAPGTYTVVASFPGNADYSAAQSAPITFTIAQGTTTIALASSDQSAVYGQSVTLVATVAAAVTPGGTVSFSDDGTLLATVPVDGSGQATLTTSGLGVGTQSITATYNGDADFLGVQSGAASESVSQAATRVVLVPVPVHKKKKVVSIALKAEIESIAPGGGVPTGQVLFELVKTSKKKTTVTTLGTMAVGGGDATLTTKAKKVLHKTIRIVYSGDPNFEADTVTTPE